MPSHDHIRKDNWHSPQEVKGKFARLLHDVETQWLISEIRASGKPGSRIIERSSDHDEFSLTPIIF